MGRLGRRIAAVTIATLRKWGVYLGRREDYLRQVTARLEAAHEIRAQRAIARFLHNGGQ
jgi:hypothetical protein